MSVKTILTASVMAGALFAGAAVPATAVDRRERCEQKVRKAEDNLQKAVRRHGEHSRQAEQKRDALERARANCRDGDHDRH
jgi:F0F1-type ATP synthase epsilon subunit